MCNGFLCATIKVLLLNVKTPFKPKIDFPVFGFFRHHEVSTENTGGHKLCVN